MTTIAIFCFHSIRTMDKGENSGLIKGVFADSMYVYRTCGVNILLQASKQPDAQTSKLLYIN